ncbi:DUF3187 family protein [Ferrimonas balearica]|uniref:DUF3187 family protein n=1 Tax=Ferrimonas balearica TaxID=44012 RepID=UPI001C99FFE0|nr:DUF3187 family protein [Ferrimonas balearica]MBY5922430.1 DUF3187 family protein [Ferrimonas balearica]MBY5995414.1 DUF3187 family protein [Ferrimonas balearica]
MGLSTLPADAAETDPLWARSQAPLKSLMLSPIARPTEFKPREWQIALSVNPASIFATDRNPKEPDVPVTFELDYYTVEYRVDLRFNPTERWQLSGSYAHRTTDDAHLDQLTLSFHKLFGLGQNGRDQVPKHRYLISLPQQGVTLTDFGGETFAHQFELAASFQAYRYFRHQLAVTVSAQYNDQRYLEREGDDLDLGLQLDYSYEWQDHRLNALMAYTHTGAKALLGTPTKQELGHFGVGYRYRITPRHFLFTEYLFSQGALKALGPLADPVHEVNLGYRYQRGELALDFVMMENALNADNSADIAFNFRLSYRFDAD